MSWASDTRNEVMVGLLITKNKPYIAATGLSTFGRSSEWPLRPRGQTFNTVGQGFTELKRQLTSVIGHTQMKLNVNWELPQTMQLYRNGTQLSTI